MDYGAMVFSRRIRLMDGVEVFLDTVLVSNLSLSVYFTTLCYSQEPVGDQVH